jgi:hypothetical protein
MILFKRYLAMIKHKDRIECLYVFFLFYLKKAIPNEIQAFYA